MFLGKSSIKEQITKNNTKTKNKREGTLHFTSLHADEEMDITVFKKKCDS